MITVTLFILCALVGNHHELLQSHFPIHYYNLQCYNHNAFAGYRSYSRQLKCRVSLKKDIEIVMYHLSSYGLSFPNHFLSSCVMLLLLQTFSTFFLFLIIPLFTPVVAYLRLFLPHYHFEMETKQKIVLVYGVFTSKVFYAYFYKKDIFLKGKLIVSKKVLVKWPHLTPLLLL